MILSFEVCIGIWTRNIVILPLFSVTSSQTELLGFDGKLSTEIDNLLSRAMLQFCFCFIYNLECLPNVSLWCFSSVVAYSLSERIESFAISMV